MKRKYLVLMLMILSVSLIAADWPNFLGPKKNGMSPERGINKNWSAKKPRVLWKMSMNDGGYAGPCIAEGKMFIVDHQGNQDIVKAVDMDNGKLLWKYAYSEPAYNNYGHARSTPTFDKGRLYTISQKGMLHCFNARSGSKLWSMNMIKKFNGRLPQWEMAVSPFIDGNRLVLIVGGSKNVVVLNKYNGKLIWRGGNSDKPGYATPVIARINGIKQYLIFTAKRIIGVAANNGRVLWKYFWYTPYDVNAATPCSLVVTGFFSPQDIKSAVLCCGLIVTGPSPNSGRIKK